MRFMGTKTKLLSFIEESMKDFGALDGTTTFSDVFSGTATVASFFKENNGYEVFSSDLLYMSYVLQRAYVQNSSEPSFEELSALVGKQSPTYIDVMNYLNSLEGVEGYVWRHFTTEGTQTDTHSRMFFIPENGKKIDAIRSSLDLMLGKNLINEDAYFILLATLIESLSFYSNVSGVYAAFLKNYDPRALKPFALRPISYSVSGSGEAFNMNGLELASRKEVDILYLDPPYNNRQYAPNYHVIETIARNDNPEPRGKAGIRDYTDLKSNFCSKSKALQELELFIQSGKYKYLALSYNTEGIMDENEILRLMEKYGEAKLYRQEYLRFKSNNNGDSAHKKHIEELVFMLKRK